MLEVNGKAGDAIIFTETLTHGTLPWTAAHERRALLYKFSPGTLSYGSGAHQTAYSDYIEDMTEEERAVMERHTLGGKATRVILKGVFAMTENVNVDDVPRRDDFLDPILATLHELGGSASTGDSKIR